MVKEAGLFFISLFIIPLLYFVVKAGASTQKANLLQENHAPVVKITAPANNNRFDWNSTVPYTITVSDAEDGESEYQEIASNEVFLEVNYISDTAKIMTHSKQLNIKDTEGLGVIKSSNCLNCHAFTTKLIGPSFYDIAKRYPYTKPNIELLSMRIKEGSKGVWGTVSMPTHPELTKEETQNVVQWILKNNTQPFFNLYRGTEGSFRLKTPGVGKPKGAFVLTASYTDHGSKDNPKQRLTGQDVIIIRGK